MAAHTFPFERCSQISSTRFVASICLLLLGFPGTLYSQVVRPDRVEVLIESLASSNKRPPDQSHGFAKDYDRKAQAIVYLSANQLLREDANAIRALVAIDKDERYSFTYVTPFGHSHYSVEGAAAIVLRKMTTFEEHAPHGWLTWKDWPKNSIKDWIKEQKFSTLNQLQRLAVAEQLKVAEAKVFQPGLRSNRYVAELSEEEFDKRKGELITGLKQVKARLDSSKEPIIPLTIDQQQARVWGLPWDLNEEPW